MKKLLSITLHSSLLLLTFSLFAGEIHSPYAMNFYTAPEWLPETVATTNTPGSDSTVEIQCWTNRIVTAWELAADSKVWAMGEYCWTWQYPVWDGEQWGGNVVAEGMSDYGSFGVYVFGHIVPNYDEYTTEVEADGRADAIELPSGDPIGSENFYLHFTREVSNDVHVVTNNIKRRITFDTESSFYHTLDGWCEREYFTGLGHGETNHVLKTTPLETIGTNRTIVTQRITGKTNQWNVADRMLSISRNDWRAGFTVEDSPYTHTMQPYWSSQAFDEIYGPQMPEDIYWTSSGLYDLARKCAVLRGVTNEVVWGGSDTNGWFYTEMFPDDFCYGLTNRYPLPVVPPGHDFGFPDVVSTDFEHVIVNSVTGKTLRIERRHQAAVNQAMTTLDRTIHSVGPVSPGTGTDRHIIRHHRYWSDSMALEDVGWEYDAETASYRLAGEAYIYPEFSTNFWTAATNAWQTSAENSDAVEIGTNELYLTAGVTVDFGSHGMNVGEIVRYLNDNHVVGSTDVVYSVSVGTIFYPDQDHVGFTLDYDLPEPIPFDTCVFDRPASNGFCSSSLSVGNGYHLREAGFPENLESMEYMPMDQAWSGNHHGRVLDCDDICTASIGVFRHQPGGTNLTMHCSVKDRSRYNEFVNIHSNEWVLHDFRLRNTLQADSGIDWNHPENYVDFTRGSVEGVLGSIKLLEDQTIAVTWSAGTAAARLAFADGVWFLTEDSPRILGISCTPLGDHPRYDYDLSAHSISGRIPIEGYVRTRITNVIDWNFNSIRKKTNE